MTVPHGRVLKGGALRDDDGRRLFAPLAPRADERAPATVDASAALAAAHRRAVDEGLKLGLQQAEQAVRQAVAEQVAAQAHEQRAALQALSRAFERELGRLRDEQRELLSDLVFAACCRLVGDALATPDGAAAAVRQVLAQAAPGDGATVQIDPADWRAIDAARRDDPSGWPAGVRFEPCESVGRGGCRIVGAAGTLDARLETRLRMLHETLDAARAAGEAAC